MGKSLDGCKKYIELLSRNDGLPLLHYLYCSGTQTLSQHSMLLKRALHLREGILEFMTFSKVEAKLYDRQVMEEHRYSGSR